MMTLLDYDWWRSSPRKPGSKGATYMSQRIRTVPVIFTRWTNVQANSCDSCSECAALPIRSKVWLVSSRLEVLQRESPFPMLSHTIPPQEGIERAKYCRVKKHIMVAVFPHDIRLTSSNGRDCAVPMMAPAPAAAWMLALVIEAQKMVDDPHRQQGVHAESEVCLRNREASPQQAPMIDLACLV